MFCWMSNENIWGFLNTDISAPCPWDWNHCMCVLTCTGTGTPIPGAMTRPSPGQLPIMLGSALQKKNAPSPI